MIVAVDHPLYMWPVAGLEDRRGLIGSAVAAGADGFIASYGTLRDCADAFADCTRIMKLDLATVSVGAYRDSEFRLAWTVDDAARIGADAVLTFVQLGTHGELDALVAAARVAAEADRAGLAYVCEIMPVERASTIQIRTTRTRSRRRHGRRRSSVRTSSRRRCRRPQRRSHSRRRVDSQW